MLANKELTVAEANAMIAELDTIADRLFAAGNTFLGNQVQECAYLLSANFAEDEE